MAELIKGSFRTAIAIFLACIALFVAVTFFIWAKDSYDKRQAIPYESIRDWEVDRKDTLGVLARAKTKVVSGKLLVSIDIDGYPSYLSNPKNNNAQFLVEFLDWDGFKIITKPLIISEFTTIIGKSEEKIGLRYQFDEYIDLESYKQFSKMQVGWTVDTKAVPSVVPEADPQQLTLDHCAPNLSKAERLKRLAQHGTVRESGADRYTAAGRSLSFLSDGTLLDCG